MNRSYEPEDIAPNAGLVAELLTLQQEFRRAHMELDTEGQEYIRRRLVRIVVHQLHRSSVPGYEKIKKGGEFEQQVLKEEADHYAVLCEYAVHQLRTYRKDFPGWFAGEIELFRQKQHMPELVAGALLRLAKTS